jgi:NitT/TauT family transport system substrate-binding protein
MDKYRFFAIIALVVFVLSACGPSASTTAPAAIEPTKPLPTAIEPTQTQIPTEIPVPTQVATQTAQPLVPVKVCYSAISGTQSIVIYAKEKGIFEKYGLDIDPIFINGGAKSITAILAGSVDICQVAGTSVVNAVVAGQDAVLIAGIFDRFISSLMAQPEIKTPADLKGKTIGIPDFGGSTEAVLEAGLKQSGLDPAKDITFLAIGDATQRITAMETKQIAATLFTPPATLDAKKKGYNEIINLSQMDIPFQHTAIATSRAFIKNHREVASNFLKAMMEAIYAMKKDPQGAKTVIASFTKLDPTKDAAAIDEAYNELILKDLKDIPQVSIPGIQFLIDSAAVSNPDAAKITPEMVVDTSLLDEIIKGGFEPGLQK